MSKKTKVERFVDTVQSVVDSRNPRTLRYVIGDSTERVRTPSVEQLARFTETSIVFENTPIAGDLRLVKNYLLKNKLLQRVRNKSTRTDAYVWTELTTALNKYVVNNETRRNEVNRLINSY